MIDTRIADRSALAHATRAAQIRPALT